MIRTVKHYVFGKANIRLNRVRCDEFFSVTANLPEATPDWLTHVLG
jgi:hypothetical protein